MRGMVLVVADDVNMTEQLREVLEQHGSPTAVTSDHEVALRVVVHGGVDVVIIDASSESYPRLQLCKHVRTRRPDVPVLIAMPRGSIELAITSLRAGAFDLFDKPMDLGEVVVAFERALQYHVKQIKARRLQRIAVSCRSLPATRARPRVCRRLLS